MELSKILAVILFASPIAFGLDAKSAEKPNVLFIAVDDLNDFPAYTGRYPEAVTPHMNRLAKSGTIFENAYCQFPTCGPSRSSLMSGMLPTTIGGYHKLKDEALQQRAAELQTKLLHEYFADQGYETLAVGKICHNHVPEGSVDASGGRGSFDAGIGRLRKNWANRGTGTDWTVVDKPDAEFPDHQAADWAIKKLQGEHDRPFMLMVGFLSPHVPWYVPQKWFDLYDPTKLTLPPYQADDLEDVPALAKELNIRPEMPRTEWAIENDQWRQILHAYLASVSFTDHQLGRVLDALDASPYKDNTIIVLWSDHGYHMGEKNTFQKHSPWERSGHVPLIFAGAGIGEGKHCQRVVNLLDIYPTLLELCGLPPNQRNEGRSLAPLIDSPELPWPYPGITSWRKGTGALQTERFRYIRYKDGSEELYDHVDDPNEWTNIAAKPEMKEVIASFSKQLDKLNLPDSIQGVGR